MMNDEEGIKIVLSKPCRKSAPGATLAGFVTRDFRAGQVVDVELVEWPGKLFPKGSFANVIQPEGAECWKFWTSGDIDLAFIFVPDDVAQVIVPGGADARLLVALGESGIEWEVDGE